MNNGRRPYAEKSAVELEALFEQARGDTRALAILKTELGRRTSRRAIRLRTSVEAEMQSAGAPTNLRDLNSPEYLASMRTPSPSDVEPAGGPPPCPVCDASMTLRTARQGRNAGGQFWGCSRYPDCKGTRNLDDEHAPVQASTTGPSSSVGASKSADLPVAWGEGVPRPDFVPEYVSIGAVPGVLREQLKGDLRLERFASQCLMLSRRSRPRQATDHARLASALLIKLLQRGRAALPTLAVEHESLRQHGCLDSVNDLALEGTELGWAPHSGSSLRVSTEAVLALLAERDSFALDPIFRFEHGSDTELLQSDAEAAFLERWVPENLGPTAGHWFTPQASLDKLLESAGLEEGGARRIDFLFCHPGGPPFAIEIDGPEHEGSAESDEARDESLRAVGIEVLRVTNEEVLHGVGAALDRIRMRCEEALAALRPPTGDEQTAAALAVDSAIAAKVQFALARAVGFGWLTPDEDWEVVLRGTGSVAAAGVFDALRLLRGFDVLYGAQSVPLRCTVRADGDYTVTRVLDDDGDWREATDSEARGERLTIAVEQGASPFQHLARDASRDIVIRPAFVPVALANEHTFDFGRRPIEPATFPDAGPALRDFLRTVFRKCEFREMQGEAVFNALRQNDCVVLLPTGAGKSIIYQLAGLLMPGVTLVVDPLVSLIEDQVEGLLEYGIDRAAPIVSNLSTPDERKRLLLRVERGEYQFVLHSPERLQSPQFRSALRALAESSLVNLAVIDEAHCVSEWGHDFRPAYLNLANNLRRFGADRASRPPPLLALTGTASRAVLRDVLAELGIDRSRSDALIRPESFDRAELSFEIVRTSPAEDPQAALRGVLNALPAKFGLPRTELYRTAGRDTASGIVFVPTVNARIHGVGDAHSAVRSATGAEVTIYSGSAPRQFDAATWDLRKRENASAFKRNHAPILVATKAFGMGIDKPNIRYTVHFGMPGSLESFYQEAGRAGRDRKPARCTMIFSEYDSARSDTLLDPEPDLEALRIGFAEADRNRRTGDDVTRALWFHLQAFSGAETDIAEVEGVLDKLDDLSARQRVEIPFRDGDDRKSLEKAIFRLLKLGVIRDYEVEYGPRKFVIDVDTFDIERCKIQLLDYVHAAQPAKSKIVARELAAIDPSKPRLAALALARMLIEFTYDVVERSRRRMLQESVLLARQARNDAEIRARLLDYLQEGLGAEHIEQLLDAEDVDLAAWWELVGKVQTAMDAGELRGLCIRALESYPDHPGLLLTRAVAESMCSDHDDGVSSQGIGAAIRSAVGDYGLSAEDVEPIVDEMFDLALTRARDLGPALTLALLDLDEAGPAIAFAVAKALRRSAELDDPRVRAVTATRKMREVVARLDIAVDSVVRRYGSPAVTRALTGV